jgi:uncharacterized protein YxjI
MSEPAPSPANWYPDPLHRHEMRYFDGTVWTDHVSNGGVQSLDPVQPSGVDATGPATRIQRQVDKAGVGSTSPGGGTLFTEPVLVVNQKAKLIELSNEYAIYDQHGNRIGAIRQVGQSAIRKAVRLLTSFDQYLSHTLEVVDDAGAVQLTVTRPSKVFKSRFLVSDAAGNDIGQIVQKNMIGKIRFGFEIDGHEIGTLNGENWRAWNFAVHDANGEEVARITKTWEGLAKTMFTTADNYVVQIHRPLEEPLRSFVVASALSVDTALKQDKRGFN